MSHHKDVPLNNAISVELWNGDDYETMSGYKLLHTSNIFMFARFDGWNLAGIVVTRPSLIKIEQPDSIIKFFNKVIRKVYGKHVSIPLQLLQTETMRHAVEFAVESELIVSVEGLGDTDFEIVRMFGISDTGVMIKILNADGQWVEKTNWVKISDISRMDIFDPYCTGLEDYFTKA